MAMLWILNLSDGKHDLLETARISGIDIEKIISVAEILCEYKLIESLID